MSVAELANVLTRDAPPLVLDVRWSLAGSLEQDYLAGHIPGAVFCDLEHDLTDPSIDPAVAGRHPLPSAERARRRLEAIGVRDDRPVVTYDGGDGIGSSRAWWVLTYFGHHNVRVLDGGFRLWASSGGAVDSGPAPQPAIGTFSAQPGHLPQVDIAEAAEAAQEHRLLDVRAAERFAGRTEPIDPVAGRIPGAANLPVGAVTAPDGRLRSASEIAELVPLTLPPEGVPVVSCGSGVTATRAILALRTIGIEAALFNGSYSQWCRDPHRFVERD